MRQLKTAFMLATLVLAGCGAWNDLFGSKESAAMQPPTCSRDPLEVIIARAGMACSATNPCPSGSYCNASAVCAWTCYSDSECATGQVCGCDGRCTGSTSSGADGGTTTTDLSCNKDATLLYKIKPGSSPTNIPPDLCDSMGHCPIGAQCNTTTNTCNWVRACDNDERCPAGSYCDPATGTCSWDCQPNVACPNPSQTCSCSGRCVVPGSTPSINDPSCEPRQNVGMTVSPRTSFIEGSPTAAPSWTRTVEITLSSPVSSLIASFGAFGYFLNTHVHTYVVPRDNLQVNCAGTWTSSSCLLPTSFGTAEGTDGWFFEALSKAPDPVTYRGRILVQLRAKPGVVAPRWHADVFTPGASNSPQGLDFSFNSQIATLPSGPPNWRHDVALPDNVTYSGTLQIESSIETNGLDSTLDGPSPATSAAFARTIDGQLHIFDPSRTISASGTVIVQPGGVNTSYYLQQVADPRLTLNIHGNVVGGIQVDPATNALKGDFFAYALDSNVIAFNVNFSLTPLPAGQQAPTIPDEPPANPYEPNYVQDVPWLVPWFSQIATVAYDATIEDSSSWLKDIYDIQRGVAAPQLVSKPPLIAADITLPYYPPTVGKETCSASFLNGYVQHLNTSWIGSDHKDHTSTANVVNFEFHDICQQNDVYPFDNADRLANFIPCVDGTHNEAELQARAGLTETAYCLGFYNNQTYSGFPVVKPYQNWLSEDCYKVNTTQATAGILHVQQMNTTNKPPTVDHIWDEPVYICPKFKQSLVRLPNSRNFDSVNLLETSPAEAEFCYDPTRSDPTHLWSGRLTDGADAANTLEFSGDLLCQDDSGTFAPTMFPLIEHADRVARGEQFPSSADSAADLFDACVSELKGTAPALTDADFTSTAITSTLLSEFSGADCVSLPRFIMALLYFERPGSFPAVRDQKLLSHILKQWIEVHSFVSYQGLQESKLRRVLASAADPATAGPVTTGGQNPGTLPPIQYEQLIDLANQGWEPVLTAYDGFRQYLLNAVSDPDYRNWSGSLQVYSLYPERQAHQDQWLPLPVVMVEGLTQELRLLQAYLEQAALEAYSANSTAPNTKRDQALARYGATMRLLFVVEGAASVLRHAVFLYPSDPILDRWNTAVGELRGLRENVKRVAAALSLGRNPLGIDEDDLPIFFGDPQGTNSQYFASSDYLVNQWAIPAVTAAETSITSARDAWLQARNAQIQDRMTQTQREQRVDDLKATQGQKLIDNCGLTGVDSQDVLDAFAGGTPDGTQLQPATCFIDPSCLGRATPTATDLANKVTTRQIQFTLCTLNETSGYRNLPEPMATCASMGALVNGCQIADLYNDFNSGLVPSDAVQRADLVCQGRLGFRAPLPSAQDLVGAVNPACYRGKMGAAALQIISAKQDVDIARQNWDVAQQSFELDAQYCESVEQAEDEAATRAMDLQQTLDAELFVKGKLEAELRQEESCSDFMSRISFSGSLLTIGMVPDMDNLKRQIADAQNTMTMAQQDYNAAMAIKQANDTIRTCWHNVDKSQLAIASAYAQITRRLSDATDATDQFKTMMNENLQALRQGANDVKREKNRYISTVAHHYWLSEKVDKFDKDFEWAKRMTYLAMRAVEYEFQQTLPLRQTVLAASHPDQLQDAIRTLEQEVGTRTINRRRPSESSIVLSLRDDVLALPDHSTDPTGERQLTPLRGLQDRLTDPRFAVNDKEGNWLGQGIPFNLGPEGALNYRCGERLWRITATVQGDALSDSQPGVSLLVLKRNTFASQWCQGEGDGGKFQYGSIQPSRRLFAENGTGALESEANGFSTALLYPWFNIRRTDFYKDSYRDGASEELAGRGLYGDYVLLFPRDVLEGTPNDQEACVSVKRGFPLDQVEDVLIRFDYLSVDNLPDLQQ